MRRAIFLISLALAAALSAEAQAAPAAHKTVPALLVIDVQNAFLPNMDQNEVQKGLPTINYVIDLFRRYGFPVIRVQHTNPGAGPPVTSSISETG